ncbi:tRNA pseudouridine(38-40) synthase TruA [Borrelia hermsii]|uniref:tRNA pseudouridine synthase A n=3 Tax=Borrelia hermsii TaxID=140 RepID=TRUA_BORHD|nr:tRNA pseudouridine(38-40) synthase TruA [Borrelia hermsii]B2S1K1.1 RecName: Full=tRNA pseudouridine synthase A; AltName: Full=tRNA pseudouridine(38-40) synthase; AltName: Full=tRNA pseudouridylate synthase I; AltName: Full=tRNA-uridine isomerase I [Borrelia hermsii DAH]AAX16538.1 tRNA pseudouridine synthase A [Borrelia hermsii DAH]AJW72849.1 pseudouridine synthase [Borrelia hermsii CC1]AMR75795.1 tRNA pseudouridine synthase A [Borrelia hermsii]ANA42837.1 pseudouridine synthase [Borrelia her
MKKILAEIAYDGSLYYGFQIQPTKPTIQGEIEKALEKISKTKVKVHSAGRTDKGVHARGQIISFYIRINIKLKNLKTAINSLLRKDIRIIKLKYVADEFQPRFNAKRRKYSYYILNNENHYPWEGYQAYYVKKKLNINRLNEMAKMLIGIHDFTTFSCIKDQTNSKLKKIYFARFKKKNKLIIFEIIGSSFLWKMVRSIVGTIIDIEIKNEPVYTFKKILNSKNRKFTRTTAPAKALFLDKVFYE